MSRTRLEAFSDGVIAILITIMVLDLRRPAGVDVTSLRSMAPVFSAYVLSFVFLGIYWNNHHHLLHAATRVNGKVLWANLHLLFWLSLIPFVTSWIGESHLAPLPTAVYGADLVACGVAYTILQTTLIRAQGPGSLLGEAIGIDLKGKLSLLLYLVAVLCAFVAPWGSAVLYVLVALMWLVPDPRIERTIES